MLLPTLLVPFLLGTLAVMVYFWGPRTYYNDGHSGNRWFGLGLFLAVALLGYLFNAFDSAINLLTYALHSANAGTVFAAWALLLGLIWAGIHMTWAWIEEGSVYA